MGQYSTILSICTIVLATSAISITVCETKIFEPSRNFIKMKSCWLGKLISCPYCTSHWISFLFVVAYKVKMIQGLGMIDYLVTAFAIVSLATFCSYVLCQTLLVMDIMGKGGDGK